MTDIQSESWFSTYGIITAQRILEGYKVHLPPDNLIHALKTPDTFYHRLLIIPIENVFNGIILQQARDYQLYVQKLFIDYLLSGESAKGQDTQGATLREDLEMIRKELLEMNDEFHKSELAHEGLIAKSQKVLMKDVESWQNVLIKIVEGLKKGLASLGIVKSEDDLRKSMLFLLTTYDFKGIFNHKEEIWSVLEKLLTITFTAEAKQIFLNHINKITEFTSGTEAEIKDYHSQIKDMGADFRRFRTTFYNFIIRANDLIKLLPEYKVNMQQTIENKEALHFDSSLGGNTENL